MAAEPTPDFTEVQLRALIEIVALVAYADGSLASAELEVLQRRLRDLSANDELLGSLEEILLSVRPTRRPTGAERARAFKSSARASERMPVDARRSRSPWRSPAPKMASVCAKRRAWSLRRPSWASMRRSPSSCTALPGTEPSRPPRSRR